MQTLTNYLYFEENFDKIIYYKLNNLYFKHSKFSANSCLYRDNLTHQIIATHQS